jgi:succinyl-diaminopimelate desuccinylase
VAAIPHVDGIALAQDLIRRPSITPEDAGALDVLQQALESLGFTCHRLTFEEAGTPDVDNLYARLGTAAPNFCFAGHTDVVPVGDTAAWSRGPFDGEIVGDDLFGRGASDMKGAIAAFTAAVSGFLQQRNGAFPGSISLLITGDEEGPAVNGTVKVLQWMAERGETIDACVVGEPTNPNELGEMVKIGRRGSLTGRLTVHGTQGHVAYPHLADNPIPRLVAMLKAVNDPVLDEGNDHFQASNLEITTIDVGNAATNVIPAEAGATFNIRFNTEHSGESLSRWLRARCAEVGGAYDLDIAVGSEPFLTPPGAFSDLIADAVESVLGRRPELSTTGGTSDARFIKDYCPVAEFGMVGQTMHKVDERASVSGLKALAAIYQAVLERYFPP